MLKNHITLIIRNLSRNIGYSIINIVGLGIGIAASFVILMYVQQELSYEKHFDDHEQTYRIGTKFMSMGRFANGPEILLNTINEEFPYIQKTSRVNGTGDISLSVQGFEVMKSGLYIDSSFFDIFDYEFEFGSRSDALNEQNSIVISVELSRILFATSDATGRLIEIEDEEMGEAPIAFKVTGVIDTDGINSHVNADFWAYRNFNREMTSGFDNNWFSISTYNYIKINKGIDHSTVQMDLDSLVARHIFPTTESNLSFQDWFNRDDSFEFIAQPIGDIYLKSTLNFDIISGGDETTVYVLLITALLIIVIAAVNFINLTTAKAVNRAKEVGVKKCLGSSRSSLIAQFISESIMISLIAMVLAMGFSELFLILFDYVTGQPLLVDIFTSYVQLGWLLMISLTIGFLAGIYPALHLSGYKTITVLKGGFNSATGKSAFRNVLVVFQFFLSITLICLAWIVHDQLGYLTNKDLGFDQEHVLIIDNASKLENKTKAYKDKLSQRAEVSSSAFFRRLPGSTDSYSMTSLRTDAESEPLRVNRFRGDEQFIKTIGFQLIEGRDFTASTESEQMKIILNESAVKALSLSNPVGTILENKKEVIGVVRDFNFENLRNEVAPAVIETAPTGNIAIKLKSSSASQFIEFAESSWKVLSPSEPIQYHFLDQNFGKMIEKERVLSKAISIFTVLSIFISCLGLYGLSSFMALQRKKEIGIRKVLGASVFNMWLMLSKQFSKLVIVATAIAIPITVWIAQSWLEGFAYRIGLSSGIFIISGIGVLFVALCTVGFESVKAAISNPVDSLKEE